MSRPFGGDTFAEDSDSSDEEEQEAPPPQPVASTSQLPPAPATAKVKQEEVDEFADEDSNVDIFDRGSDDEDEDEDGRAKYDNGRRHREPTPEARPVPGRPFQKKRLRPYKMRTFTARHLVNMEPPGVELNPAYQRDAVWKVPRAMDLIHSVMSNFYIPPLLFNSIQCDEDSERETLVCVDGKQRTTSLIKFMSGETQYIDDSGKAWVYDDKLAAKNLTIVTGMKKDYRPLPAEDREYFDKIVFQAAVYDDLDSLSEQKMFAKIQQGMELNAQEKLKALESTWKPYGDTVEDEYINEPGTISRMMRAGEAQRAKGYLLLFRVWLWLRKEGSVSDISLITDLALKKHLQDPKIHPSNDIEWEFFTDRLDRLRNLSLLDEKDDKLHWVFSHRVVAPIELLFLPIIIHKWFPREDGDLLEIIELFRRKIYANFPGEIKTNAKVFNFAKAWILKFNLSSLKKKYNNDGRKPNSSTSARPRPCIRSESVSSSSSAQPLAARIPAPAKSTKRPARDSPPAAAPAAKRKVASGPVGGPERGASTNNGSSSMFTQKVQPVMSAQAKAKRTGEQEQRNMFLQGGSYASPPQANSGWGAKKPNDFQQPAPNPSPVVGSVNSWLQDVSAGEPPPAGPSSAQISNPNSYQPPPHAQKPPDPRPKATYNGSNGHAAPSQQSNGGQSTAHVRLQPRQNLLPTPGIERATDPRKRP
ncbi:hypothetical protein RQP46_008847 [Phenoliferia psychrophenolica]